VKHLKRHIDGAAHEGLPDEGILRREEVRGERAVMRVRIGIAVGVILMVLIVAAITHLPDRPSLIRFTVVIPTACLYLILSLVFVRRITEERYRPIYKYVFVTFDFLFMLVAIIVLRMTLVTGGPVMAIDTPAFWGILTLNAVTGIRLDRKLSTHCAVLSMIIFIGLVAFDLSHLAEVGPTTLMIVVMKGGMLLTIALVSGQIGVKARRLILENLAEQRQKEVITKVFGRYVSGPVAERLIDGDIALGGREKKITVLFSDIRDFTPMSEKLPPQVVVGLLNDYFDAMVGAVFAHDGILNKFIGDGMMAIFGAPEAVGDEEERAVRAALEMRERLREFNRRQIAKETMVTLSIGIGITTGPAVIGNIGSLQRMEYTAIGDTVNTASRLVGVSKEVNADILIDGATYEAVRGRFAADPLGTVKVKGKDTPVRVYRVTGEINRAADEEATAG
jgi:class 3 adenylate cyclase